MQDTVRGEAETVSQKAVGQPKSNPLKLGGNRALCTRDWFDSMMAYHSLNQMALMKTPKVFPSLHFSFTSGSRKTEVTATMF